MADITLDTTSVVYQQLLARQEQIADAIRPRLRIVKLLLDRGEPDKARRLIRRDPLLLRELRKAKLYGDFAGELL